MARTPPDSHDLLGAFAAPRRQTIRPDTELSWWGMRSSFPVGASRVEVETGHWSGHERYFVDGQPVAATRNLGWHTDQTLQVDGHVVRVTGRWYPLLPVQVTVDGVLHVDDLFPQLAPVKALLATAAVPGVLLGLSIAWDLLRLARLEG